MESHASGGYRSPVHDYTCVRKTVEFNFHKSGGILYEFAGLRLEIRRKFFPPMFRDPKWEEGQADRGLPDLRPK